MVSAVECLFPPAAPIRWTGAQLLQLVKQWRGARLLGRESAVAIYEDSWVFLQLGRSPAEFDAHVLYLVSITCPALLEGNDEKLGSKAGTPSPPIAFSAKVHALEEADRAGNNYSVTCPCGWS